MIFQHNIYNSIEASYDPFAEEKSNTNRIKALLLVQADVVQEVLTDRQKDIVRLVILEEHTQKYTANLLGVSKFCISRELKKSINVLQNYLHFCDLALRHYESLSGDKNDYYWKKRKCAARFRPRRTCRRSSKRNIEV